MVLVNKDQVWCRFIGYLLFSIPLICFCFLSAVVLRKTVWIFSVAKSTATVSHQVERLVTFTRLVWYFNRMIKPVKVQNRCKTGLLTLLNSTELSTPKDTDHQELL